MKHVKLFESFLNEAEFPSALDIGDSVTFIPSAAQARDKAISREERFGKVVAVRFTVAKVFYDVLDDYYGVIFDNLDSVFVKPFGKNKEEK